MTSLSRWSGEEKGKAVSEARAWLSHNPGSGDPLPWWAFPLNTGAEELTLSKFKVDRKRKLNPVSYFYQNLS